MPTLPMARLACLVSICLAFTTLTRADDKSTAGERIYRDKCASCHGDHGEGSKEYKKPLAGDRSVNQLQHVIAETMPEDDPGTCVGEEARSVAAYIHDSFYSRTAQARNKPARVELARLTVPQYRNAVSDLVGSFRWDGVWDENRGLKGQYYRSNQIWKKEDRAIDRVDPQVKFDFGVEAPGPENFKVYEFSIVWRGSVLAPETGDYEFVVRSDQGIRLFVNDSKKPLIDAWVRSGTDTEHRGSIFLIGGRPYPIQLDFTKSKQGVNDSDDKKAKAPPMPASVSLEWKLPNRPVEVIASRYLSTHDNPALFVSSTPFPPDDRSVGYDRGTSVSKAWDQATTDGALEVAAYVASHLKELSGVDDSAPDRAEKLKGFASRFAERAFRRPLTDEQKQAYVTRHFEQSRDVETAVKRSLVLVLKSPRFLYREVGGHDAFEVASKLAFTLWDAPPDRQLLEAAANGWLKNPEQIRQQANRMATNLRARAKLRAFFLQWLRVDQVPDVSKDPMSYPSFDPAVASDLRTSLDLFLEEVIWSDSSDFRQLLTGEGVYLNGRLARLYGGDLPPDAPFQKVSLDTNDRAGLLTHPYLMANFAYTSTSSPIHRGVFLARSVLGRSLRPPPEAVAPLAPDLHAGLSTRERVTLQTSPRACASCHEMINPLGFAFEHFDAIGRFRIEEKGKPVDAEGVYEPPSGEPIRYKGARGLATALASSEEARSAFVEQLFHNLVQQPIRAFGPSTSANLTRMFADQGFHIRKLMVDIAVTSASASLPPTKTP